MCLFFLYKLVFVSLTGGWMRYALRDLEVRATTNNFIG